MNCDTLISKFKLQSRHYIQYRTNVTYWPSTEPSIKRCTCVNKRRNSGIRWTLNNNITSTLTARVSWEQDAEVRASGRQRASGHQWPTVVQPQQRWGRSAAMVRRTRGQYVAVCPTLQLISHTQPTSTLSRLKCERYIFIKECVRLFIEVRILCLIMFLLIFVFVFVYVYVCGYTTGIALRRFLPPPYFPSL